MDKPQNMFVAVAYKLYTVEDDGFHLVEEAPADKPFQFITGFGVTLDAFEEQIIDLEKGATFDFQLTKDQAYGDFDETHVIDLGREVFSINGHFDHEHIFKGAIVPLQNEDGNRFMGHVLEVDENKVRIDLNHPLAGQTLYFKGEVVERREATNAEITAMVNRLSGEGCDCGCEGCGGECGSGCDDHDGCGGHGHGHGGCGCGCH